MCTANRATRNSCMLAAGEPLKSAQIGSMLPSLRALHKCHNRFQSAGVKVSMPSFTLPLTRGYSLGIAAHLVILHREKVGHLHRCVFLRLQRSRSLQQLGHICYQPFCNARHNADINLKRLRKRRLLNVQKRSACTRQWNCPKSLQSCHLRQ